MTRDTVVPGHLVREVREGLYLSKSELARLLTCGVATIARAEANGAPRWLPLALMGLALARYDIGVCELARRLSVDLDAGPFRQDPPPASPLQRVGQCLTPIDVQSYTTKPRRHAASR